MPMTVTINAECTLARVTRVTRFRRTTITIAFTNAECTAALVSRGMLWWKCVAEVERPDDVQWRAQYDPSASRWSGASRWRYKESGEWLPAQAGEHLGIDLDIAREKTLAARIESNNWPRPGKLPRATVVKT